MPHGARKRAESGYYHVVPKGINGKTIFCDDSDRRLYLQLLAKAQNKMQVRIHAYCLMSNHVHLIVEDQHGHLSEFIKYVHERYGTFFAQKCGRAGGIFAKTCWSEPIESDSYLLCAVRYAHANPAAAGICKASAYEWSSAKDYLGRKGITHTNTILDLCNGRQGFIKFSQSQNSTATPFARSSLRNHLSNSESVRIASSILGFSPTDIPSFPKPRQRDAVLLLSQRGFSALCIARISGLSRQQVRECLNNQQG